MTGEVSMEIPITIELDAWMSRLYRRWGLSRPALRAARDGERQRSARAQQC